ncbi:YncE family protein [Pararcticibacter amylolyticus]|uniref:YncE family protein n=1 Tax=Pararcticibacter amylolyticus TaxID=2173175 RepID=A0A2U2PEK0_9SPHI|nr:DUF5074 domain-containing protein [Pararcticibacter amylolyticus]PWG79744.1 hypothetical protein DDR33_15120 [Pararcticibacter amylolyticus]
MKQKFLPALLLLSLAIFQACKKDREENQPKEQETIGVYVLYEGTMGQNNSGIAYYDLKTSQSNPDYFKTVNGYDLGETANDLQQYGSKIYCVVTGKKDEKQSFVEVINPVTGKSIKRISFNGASSGFLPRYIAFHKNKAYVSNYDGKIRRIDTASLQIDEQQVETGGAMEKMAIVNDKLYVVNSDHYDFRDAPNKHTVSVIDLNTFTKIKDIPVTTNPVKIAGSKNGDVFVASSIPWGGIGTYQKINLQTDAVTSTFSASIGDITIHENKGFAIVDPYTSNPAVKELNLSTGELGNSFITDGTQLKSPNRISVNTLTNEIVVSDVPDYTSPGKAYYFKADGKLAVTITTGINPNSAVFIYGTK